MDAILPWVIRLAGGAVGGNLFGALIKKLSLGGIGNSIVGMLGGGIGGQLLSMFGLGGGGEAGASMDLGSILANVGSSGAGGGVLMVVIGALKKMMSKS